MKHLLAPLFLLIATSLSAQQLPTLSGPLPTPIDGSLPSSIGEERVLEYFTPVFRNADARYDPFVPYRFPLEPGETVPTELRGVGQIFAPAAMHAFYSGSVYNDSTAIYFDPNGGATDQDYIDQLLNAGPFRLDSVQLFVYQPFAAGRGSVGGKVVVARTTEDFLSASYRENGFSAQRPALEVLFELPLGPEALDQASPTDSTVFATRVRFGGEGLSFAAGESAVIFYVNEEGSAVGPEAPAPNADGQRVITYLEYASGSRAAHTLADSLDAYKSLGVVVLRNGTDERIVSAWKLLTVEGYRGIIDMRMAFWGSVTDASGVDHPFAPRSSAIVAGEVTPTPATEVAWLPVSTRRPGRLVGEIVTLDGRSLGRCLDLQMHGNEERVPIDLRSLPAGTFFLRLSLDGESVVRRIVRSGE